MRFDKKIIGDGKKRITRNLAIGNRAHPETAYDYTRTGPRHLRLKNFSIKAVAPTMQFSHEWASQIPRRVHAFV